MNYGLGYFFVGAFAFSLALGIGFRKLLQKQMVNFDLIFLASILLVIALNMYLGVALNLKVPYTSTIKYTYQILPFFCLIAASLALKCKLLSQQSISGTKRKLLFVLVGIGILLLAAAILSNINSAHQLSLSGFIIFEVELGKLLGYSFDNFYALSGSSGLMWVQYVGFGLVLFGVIYPLRGWLKSLANQKLTR